MVCPNMKRIDLPSVLSSLQDLKYEITLPDDILKRARFPLERMMEIGRGD
jgi:quinolinate synthase